MASSSTFSLGHIIKVSVSEKEDIKCFGMTSTSRNPRPCARKLGEERKLAARDILQHTIAHEDLSGDLVKGVIKTLAQTLVHGDHNPECRARLENEWLGLLEEHRKAQVDAHEMEQRLGPETTTSPPIASESTETSATTELSVTEDSIPKSQVRYPPLRMPDSPATNKIPVIQEPILEEEVRYPSLPNSGTEASTTDVTEKIGALAPTSAQNTLETLSASHPTPFPHRIPTIHENFSVNLSSNWILSCMMGFVMQIGQQILAMIFVRFGSVSTQDQTGRATKPVTHFQFLFGVNIAIKKLNLAFCIHFLLIVALIRLLFSVLWPLSGLFAGGCILLLVVSGVWNRRLALEE
ncbi:hypothetical protein N7523_006721 [Penicillium sp. IBT 18751x]|nr:hypothetical protein N7523_006721 [Penicillium sp. IBT 18751x]